MATKKKAATVTAVSRVLSPLRVGNAVYIRTVTMHHTGLIEAITAEEVVLSSAAWIADSGRFHTALTTGRLSEVEPFPEPVSIGRGSIVDVTTWAHPLPMVLK